MYINEFLFKVKRKLKYILGHLFFQYPRIIKYKLFSTNRNIGNPRINQPVLINGGGIIIFGKNVNLGVVTSPFFYSGYGYLEARNNKSSIQIGDNVWINNNIVIISEGAGIIIGNDTLVGSGVEIIDSDFHDLYPSKRMGGTPKNAKVKISNNVFIGNNVRVLKGVSIGENSVIANSSVVTKSIPANVIAGGNPCKVIKKIDFN